MLLGGLVGAAILYAQGGKSDHGGVASWGFVTTYQAATASDSPFRSARNALYDGLSGEAPLNRFAFVVSSISVDSGGLCTTCTSGGPAYCYDTLNNCGGTYNNAGQNNCGCGSSNCA